MSLSWLLLILALALVALGALRWDLLVARWRELTATAPAVREPPPSGPARPEPGPQAHEAPPRKPAIHRSGKRH